MANSSNQSCIFFKNIYFLFKVLTFPSYTFCYMVYYTILNALDFVFCNTDAMCKNLGW